MTSSRLQSGLLAICLLGFGAACADPTELPDAGVPMDATSMDAEPASDAEPAPDAEPSDASVPEDATVSPDAEPVDAGPPGLKLKSSNLSPATGRATSPTHNLNGHLRPSSPVPAASPSHRLRGGLVPGGTQAVTP